MFRLFTFLVLFVCFTSSAQSISPITINVGGGVSKSLDYSIGESASIAYFQSSNQISLSTGFIQSFTPLVTGIVNRIFEEGEAFVLSPNPGIDRLRLKGQFRNQVLLNSNSSTSKVALLIHTQPLISSIISKKNLAYPTCM